MAAFTWNDQTIAAYNDYTTSWTTSATSVYSPYQPYTVAQVVPEPVPAPVKTGEEGWLDGELDEVMSLGRAEPVLA